MPSRELTKELGDIPLSHNFPRDFCSQDQEHPYACTARRKAFDFLAVLAVGLPFEFAAGLAAGLATVLQIVLPVELAVVLAFGIEIVLVLVLVIELPVE
jgi:hypothetical protein